LPAEDDDSVGGRNISGLVPREDFPLLMRRIEDRPINYLDSAATALKPTAVIDAVTAFYREMCANVNRGDHILSQEASTRFEQVRHDVARFINALTREVVFTSNTTDSMNLVAAGLKLGPGDNVVTSIIDHHSNMLPWLGRCETRFLPEAEDGRIDLAQLPGLIDGNTKLVAIGHVSNVTGAIQPVREAIQIARAKGVLVVVDAAQSVPHLPLDVVELGCDFLAFSAHKMLGPSGVGVLYVSEEAADRLATVKVGGGSPERVRTDGFTLKDMPYRLEAGTPNIEGVFGLGAAIAYLKAIGMKRVAEHDAALAAYMHELFAELPGVEMLGPADPTKKIAIASLVPTAATVTPATLGRILSDSHKIMARTGTHCAHPYFAARGKAGALRLSAYIYTSSDDLDAAALAIREVLR
jgi:cysteine desulfurase/selenocysteine lyase